jgi:hypothetical protein
MKVSYEEWIAARDRVAKEIAGEVISRYPFAAGRITTAALDSPMPPEPAPDSWNDSTGRLNVASRVAEVVTVSICQPRQPISMVGLDADEAEAMSDALLEHANHLREQQYSHIDVPQNTTINVEHEYESYEEWVQNTKPIILTN